MTPELVHAARRALDTHDALQLVSDAEPAKNAAGMPCDPAAWESWYDGRYKPAYAEWQSAMYALDAAAGEKIGWHPFTFRPYCAEVLGSARLAHDLNKIYTVLP